MIHRQAEDHLALPQGDRVDDGGADLLGHEGVVVLDQTDLRGHLQGDRTRQLKVVDLLFEAADHVGKVVRGLRVLGETRFLRFFLKLGKINLAKLFDAQLAGDDIHRQLFHILLVLLVHPIHQTDVLEKDDFVMLELFNDLVNVDLGLVVLSLDGGDVLAGLVEQSADALSLLGVEIQALELDDQVAEHVAHFAQILGADGVEGGVRELGDVLLRVAAVVEDLLGIEDVDLLGEFRDGGLLGGGELAELETLDGDILDLFLFLFLFFGDGGDCLGVRLKRQAGDVAFFFFAHVFRSFLLLRHLLELTLPLRLLLTLFFLCLCVKVVFVVSGETFARKHGVHDFNIRLDVESLVFKQGVETFFVCLDRGVEHLVDVLHAAVEVFTLNAERAHSVVGVEELERGRQIVIHKFSDLRDVLRIVDRILRDLVGDAHDLVDLAADLRVLDRHVKTAHFAQRAIAFLKNGIDLRTVAFLFRMLCRFRCGFCRGGFGGFLFFLHSALGRRFTGDKGAERAQSQCQQDAPKLIQRERHGRKKPYDRENIQRS